MCDKRFDKLPKAIYTLEGLLNHFLALSCNVETNVLHIIALHMSIGSPTGAIKCLNERMWAIGSFIPWYDEHHNVMNFYGSIVISILLLGREATNWLQTSWMSYYVLPTFYHWSLCHTMLARGVLSNYCPHHHLDHLFVSLFLRGAWFHSLNTWCANNSYKSWLSYWI